jgi:hypothetical protein
MWHAQLHRHDLAPPRGFRRRARGRTVQRSLQASLARYAWSLLILRAFYCIHVFVTPALMRRMWRACVQSGQSAQKAAQRSGGVARWKFDRSSAHFTAHSAPSSSGNSAISCTMPCFTHCPHRSLAISSQPARSVQGRHKPRPTAAAAAASSIELRGRPGCSKQRAPSPHTGSVCP